MTSTERLSLPYIVQSQSQKEVTHNEGLNLLDMMVQAVVMGIGLDTPPASPTLGDCYIIGNSPTDDWVAHAGELAQAITGGWRFVSPFEGLLVYDLNDDLGYRFDGSSWNSEAISELQNLSLLGINASADATNKLAVASSAVLFNNIGNGVQVKLNKNAAGDSASFLYQTNWSGRAEFGTTGDDDFHIKVSPDGSSWFEAIVIDKDNGEIISKGNRLFISPDSGNPTFDMQSIDGISDPRRRFFDAAGKLRLQEFYDISAHLFRVYTYDSAGVSEGEAYRFGNAGFNINPNNDPNIDFIAELPNGTGFIVDASANLVSLNPGNVDIDCYIETMNGIALFTNAASNYIKLNNSNADIDTYVATLNGNAVQFNAGANLVHFNPSNVDINFRIDTMNVDAAFLVDANTDLITFDTDIIMKSAGESNFLFLDHSNNTLAITADTNATNDYPLQINNAANNATIAYGFYGMSNKEGSSQTADYTIDIGRDLIINVDDDCLIQNLSEGWKHSFSNGDLVLASTAGADILQLVDAGASSAAAANPVMEFHWTTVLGGSNTRLGYIGWGSTGNTDLYLVNDDASGDIRIQPKSGRHVISVRTHEFLEDLVLSSPTVPANASAAGTKGMVSYDSDYIYICTAANTWKRTPLSTW